MWSIQWMNEAIFGRVTTSCSHKGMKLGYICSSKKAYLSSKKRYITALWGAIIQQCGGGLRTLKRSMLAVWYRGSSHWLNVECLTQNKHFLSNYSFVERMSRMAYSYFTRHRFTKSSWPSGRQLKTRTKLSPVSKETTDKEYRTAEAAREQVNQQDQDNKNKIASRYIVHELMKLKISCTVTLLHNTHQKYLK